MNALSLLSPDLAPLKTADSIGQALYRLADSGVKHLPVVNEEGQVYSIAGEDELLDHIEEDVTLGEIEGLRNVFVLPASHWFDAATLLARHHLSSIPVADQGGSYLGAIRRSDLFDRFAGVLSAEREGAILVVEVPARDFSLSQIVRLIEQNDIEVLSVFTQGQQALPHIDSEPVTVTLKLGSSETTRARHVLEHHGYHVTAAYSDSSSDENFNHRLAEFLRYLEA